MTVSLVVGAAGLACTAYGARAVLRGLTKAGVEMPHVAAPKMPDMGENLKGFDIKATYATYMSRFKNCEGFEREMTRKEAFKILNLRMSTFDKDEIRNRHRQLLLRNHPDKGGSTFIATKINEAKDVILGKGKSSKV